MTESFPKPETQPELPGYDPIRPLKKSLKFIVIIAISLILLLTFWKAVKLVQTKTSFKAHYRKSLMGTTVEIKAYGKGATTASKAAFKEMERVANLMSIYNPKSEVSLINSMAGIASIAVSRDIFDVINRSIKLSSSLSRTFDISAGPLIDLWDLGRKGDFVPPDKSKIWETLKLVDYRKIEIDQERESVKLQKRGMKLNLGGVGKGYVLAVGRNVLVQNSIKSALISTGSSITCIGKKPDGTLWNVGIRSPREPKRLLGSVALMPGQAISTSGDYEQFIVKDGKRYHHIIDPRTGYPASLCRSATIIAGDATAADILSTSVFIMGPWKGIRLLNTLENVEGLIIDSNGKMHKTAGFKFEKIEEEEEK
jgi:thiamine biosynthesis lipoprotein